MAITYCFSIWVDRVKGLPVNRCHEFAIDVQLMMYRSIIISCILYKTLSGRKEVGGVYIFKGIPDVSAVVMELNTSVVGKLYLVEGLVTFQRCLHPCKRIHFF